MLGSKIVSNLATNFVVWSTEDGRIFADSTDITQVLIDLINEVLDEPERADELAASAVERVFFAINGPEAWSRRYLEPVLH